FKCGVELASRRNCALPSSCSVEGHCRRGSGYHRKDDARRMLRVVVNANMAHPHFRGSDLGLAGLHIAREMRKKRSGNLHSDTMARLENVRSEQAIEIETINLPRF